MRKFLLFLILAMTVIGNDNYAIQVLSVKDKTSITPEFMQKVNEVSMPSQGLQCKNGSYKIYYGGIKTHKAATMILPYIREKISKDAYVLKEKDVASSADTPSAIKKQIFAALVPKPKEVKPIAIQGNQDIRMRVDKAWIDNSKISQLRIAKAEELRMQNRRAKIQERAEELKRAEIEKVEILGPQESTAQVEVAKADSAKIQEVAVQSKVVKEEIKTPQIAAMQPVNNKIADENIKIKREKILTADEIAVRINSVIENEKVKAAKVKTLIREEIAMQVEEERKKKIETQLEKAAKKARREKEIAQAIAFYSNSPYHKFSN